MLEPALREATAALAISPGRTSDTRGSHSREVAIGDGPRCCLRNWQSDIRWIPWFSTIGFRQFELRSI